MAETPIVPIKMSDVQVSSTPASSTGGLPLVFSFPGPLIVLGAGFSGPWYPPAALSFRYVRFSLGTPGTTTSTVYILKNASIVSTLSLTSGQGTTGQVSITLALTASQSVTVQLGAAGAGAKDAVIELIL